MNRMEEARKQYEEIMIPPELSVRVQSEIEKAEKRRRQTAVKSCFIIVWQPPPPQSFYLQQR